VRSLTQVEWCSANSVGVDAGDLLVNGVRDEYQLLLQSICLQLSQPLPARSLLHLRPARIQDKRRSTHSRETVGQTHWIKLAFLDVRINEFLTDNSNGIRDEEQRS